MKNFEELLRQTKTVHQFKPSNLDVSVLEHCLSLSLLAPNHKMTQPWRIFWPKELNERAHFLQWLAPEFGDSFPTLFERWMKVSQFLVFCAEGSEDPIIARENYATVCCSIQLLALSLRERGIGYKWSTPKALYRANISSYFKRSESWQFVGQVLIGTEDLMGQEKEKPRPVRKNLDQFLL